MGLIQKASDLKPFFDRKLLNSNTFLPKVNARFSDESGTRRYEVTLEGLGYYKNAAHAMIGMAWKVQQSVAISKLIIRGDSR